MAKEDILSNDEIRGIILEHLEEMGKDPGNFEVRVMTGPQVLIRGEVSSEYERENIRNFITDAAGVDNIVDELVVSGDELEGDKDDDDYGEHEMYDADQEYVGTDDVFRSVEDGVPYIPPTTASFEEKKKKKKRKKD